MVKEANKEEEYDNEEGEYDNEDGDNEEFEEDFRSLQPYEQYEILMNPTKVEMVQFLEKD